MQFIIRSYRSTDVEEMAQLFYHTVHHVNAADYTPGQLQAWASGQVDLAAWDASFRAHTTLVAEADGRIIGFADRDEGGYLDRLYVHKDYQGCGVATALCDRLEESAKEEKMTTHASITARGFFEKRGYRLIRAQQVERSGERLTNYVMEKPLEDAESRSTSTLPGATEHTRRVEPASK